MIRHFLWFDIKQNKILLIILCFLLLIFYGFGQTAGFEDAIGMWFLAFLVFGTIPSSGIIGANVRSQQTISRKYLLSLPINRVRLLFINILRGLFFYVPLYFLVATLLIFDVKILERFELNLIEFVIALFLVTVWFVLGGFHYSISFEGVSKHHSKFFRFFRFFWSFFQMAFEAAIIALLFFDDFDLFTGYFIIPVFLKILVLLVLISNRFYWTKRLWLNN